MTVGGTRPDVSRVIFVLVDALRADHVGWYAGRDVGTPTFDRLASRGVVFANAISQAPATRGSVSSVFTGFYPSQHGLVDRAREDDRGEASVAGLDKGVPTLAELLAADGHVTAAFVAGNANLRPVFGLTRGFLHVDYLPTTDGSVLVDRFERFVEAGPPGRAFCYLHFMELHHPLPMEIPSRLDQGLDLDTVEESMGQLVEYYAAAARLVDQHIGRVVGALEAARMFDDALIILTADHGEEHLEHGAMLAHGRTLYRELVHVPLIMKLPDGASAGTVVDQPVQLIDLMPTILDAAGCPRTDLAGRSLLPAIRGEGGDASLAFSELLRRDRYCQSATSSTHQLIVSYLLEESAAVSLADLRPGVTVKLKGQLTQGGSLLPTKLALTSKESVTLRGTVDAVDGKTGSLTVLGVPFRTDRTTSWVGLEEEPIEPSTLGVGQRLSATLVEASDGGYLAVKIQQRKPGGKSKIVGPIQRVADLEADFRLVTVLGTEIAVGSNLLRTAKHQGKIFDHRKSDALTRVLQADHVGREVELYDLAADPLQARNIVDKRPDIAQELEAQLAAWTEQLMTGSRVSAAGIDVDPETLEQLRRMGYLE
ncbi:MAG: sulfatase-like hydrolase/transferase [Pseudonocardiaceae bacterium]